jgi:hypothetical protein
MNTRGQYILLWSTVVVALICLGSFLLFPGFHPPISPMSSAEEVAAFYRDPENLSRTRYSMILYNWFGIGFLPLYGLIVVHIKRMNHYSDVFAYGFLAAATSGVGLFATSDLYFQIAAFRPERNPAITQVINDMAWLNFTAPVGFIVSQNVALALAIYLDKQARPVFPRWVAHFNLLIAALVAPAALAVTTLTGPFAWDGVWSFWVRLVAISLWGVVMFFVLWSAVRREKREEAALSPQALELQSAAQ